MLIVWNIVLVGSAAINVAEVFFARETLDAGTVGFGALVAASGVGLALGAYLAAPALGKVGLRRHYAGSIGLMAVGWGGAAFSGSIWVAIPLVIGGAAGNGAAIICNQILVQRGAPDRYRGRALATIMSTNYALLGLAMGAAGVLTDQYGARAVWIAAGAIYVFGAVVSLAVTGWLPVAVTDEDDLLDQHGRAAAAALAGDAPPGPVGEVVSEPVSALEPVALLPPAAEPEHAPEPEYAPEPEHAPEPEYAPEPVGDARDGSSRGSLERIAILLEEIERRRELESRRSA